MAVRIAKINAPAAFASIQLSILDPPRVTAPGNARLSHAVKDSVKLFHRSRETHSDATQTGAK